MAARILAGAAAAAVLATVPAAVPASAGTYAGAQTASAGTHAGARTAGGGVYVLRQTDRFAPATDASAAAKTYDTAAVPAGAKITVGEYAAGGRMVLTLKVAGLQANRNFGAHVHTKPCGALPDASGPHYQHVQDPQQPSSDPAYANPENEVWMDFATDPDGNGAAAAEQSWRFRPGEARSVVIHEHSTGTGHGEAGMAGGRLACFSVPFDESDRPSL